MSIERIALPDAEVEAATRESFTDLFNAVHGFMQVAGQSTGRFNARQAALYTGLQLEELGEQIEVIMEGCLTEGDREHLRPLAITLRRFAKEFRDGFHSGDIMRCDHAKLIDGQFDSAWVAIGALVSTSPNPDGAIAHGTYTNLDKFVDGKAIKDANGKVQKRPGWQPPDFEPYTDKTIRV